MRKTERHDWHRFDALTDAQVHAAALRDPDAQPLTDEVLAQMKQVPRARTLRRALGLSQEEFAERYHIPIGTLRDWEQGRTEPGQPARAYLTAIAHAPDAVRYALERAIADKRSWPERAEQTLSNQEAGNETHKTTSQMVENGPLLDVVVWPNGRLISSNTTFYIKLSDDSDRERYFSRSWEQVQVELSYDKIINVPLCQSFWNRCPELRHKEITAWLKEKKVILGQKGELPWKKGKPPHLSLLVLGGNRFRLTTR